MSRSAQPRYSDEQAAALIQAAREYGTHTHRSCAEAADGANEHGGREYWLHLDETAEVECRFDGKRPEREAACWVHDTHEDCNLKLPIDERRQRLREATDEHVEALAWAVTDRDEVPDPTPEDPQRTRKARNRRERKAQTLPLTAAHKGATEVKLDDRIANAEHGHRSAPGSRGRSLLGMYTKEQHEFERLLRQPGIADARWQHLRSILLMSDAPAGEGAFEPAGRLGHFDGRELRSMQTRAERGEADELFMPARGVLRARFGDTILECSINSEGKASRRATKRANEQASKVEYARMLPAHIDRWFRPLHVEQTQAEDRYAQGRTVLSEDLSVDELIARYAGDERTALDRCLALIHVGRAVEGERTTLRTTYSDRDRDGIREGVRRWARQHADLVEQSGLGDIVESILTGYKRNPITRPSRSL
jgi:hypothetical protein